MILVLVLLVTPRTQAQDPSQAARVIAEASSGTVQTALPGARQSNQVADGWYLVLSWSVPESLRHELIEGARRLGATVVVNGLVGPSLNDTVAAFRALAPPDKTAQIVIDPIRVREWKVATAPTLVLRRGSRYLVLSGAGSVEELMRDLAEVERGVRPTSDWLHRQPAPWWDQERHEPRPALPEVTASANHRGSRGGWPLIEEPLDRVIRDRIKQVNWRRLTDAAKERVAERLAAGPGLALPTVVKPRTRLVDPSVTLTGDFAVNGSLLFKTGQSVNPLATHTLRYRFLIIDGTDPAQVDLARRLVAAQADAAPLRVLITRGDWRRVAQLVNVQQVYWAQAPVLARWQVERVPSLITQVGVMLQVEELPVPDNRQDQRTGGLR